jgi:hypothetical protein
MYLTESAKDRSALFVWQTRGVKNAFLAVHA